MRPKTVIALDAYFEIGPIGQLESPIGQAKRFEWLNENINLEQEHYELENKFNNTLLEIEDIPRKATIYGLLIMGANKQVSVLSLVY